LSDLPSTVEPLDRAILDLLCELSGRWLEIDSDKLTHTQQKALTLMVKAGLVEERLRLRAWMDGFPQVVDACCRVSGNYDSRQVIERALRAVPDWLDDDERTRGRWHIQSSRITDVRLTDQGELAQQEYSNASADNPSCTLAFVRKRGPLGFVPYPEGRVDFESIQVGRLDQTQAQHALPTGPAVATAKAEAHMQMPELTEHLAEVLRLLAQRFAGKTGQLPAANEVNATPADQSAPGSSAEEHEAEAVAIKSRDQSRELRKGAKEDISFWIVRYWQGWREENDRRKSEGKQPLQPPGYRKVAKYLKKHGYKVSHTTVGKYVKEAKKQGLLDDEFDITDGKISPHMDPDEATTDGEFIHDPHTAGQRNQRPQEDDWG